MEGTGAVGAAQPSDAAGDGGRRRRVFETGRASSHRALSANPKSSELVLTEMGNTTEGFCAGMCHFHIKQPLMFYRPLWLHMKDGLDQGRPEAG